VMNVPTDIQIIKDRQGRPAFAVLPYDEFIRLAGGEPTIPQDVVGLTIKKGYTLVRAWREYLGLTQKEVAQRMKITQAAFSQIESRRTRLRKDTLSRLATALGLDMEQLRA
jgi:DNA-binding XRE family transcriptional regulator